MFGFVEVFRPASRVGGGNDHAGCVVLRRDSEGVEYSAGSGGGADGGEGATFGFGHDACWVYHVDAPVVVDVHLLLRESMRKPE